MMWARVCATIVLSAVMLPVTRAAASPNELLASGRVDDAIAVLQAQVKSSPRDAAPYHYLCRAYFSLQDWDHAIAAGEKATSLAADNSDYHLWLGRAYGEKADRANPFSAARLAGKLRNEFERAVQLNPNNLEARLDLAEFYLDAPGIVGGGQDKARAQLSAVATLSPEKAHYLNGRIAEKNKDQATAEKEYKAAIDASQGRANDWLNLGLFYKHNSRFDEMESALQRAANAPGQNEVLVECAEILLRTGRNLPAASRLTRRYLDSNAPTEKSPLFKAHYVLGTILERQGDKDGAAAEYRAALNLASGFSGAQQALKRVTQ
jgi:cytochrome c-type biogenesis protein CcmH/NrfG